MEEFSNITVSKVLGKGRVSVFLGETEAGKPFALKTFPFDDSKISDYYLNESRFLPLDHPNIIKIYYVEDKKRCHQHRKNIYKSLIYMEYAPHSDFLELIDKNGPKIDDKLVRTYFHQLIDGLEYLHSKGVSHMDIKLENLLIGQDFQLKIADLDLAYVKGDTLFLGSGSKYFRAPEVISGKCRNPNAADIYSAAIILFTLKTKGKLPQMEDVRYLDVDLFYLMHNNREEFWKVSELINKHVKFEEDFKNLFDKMTDPLAKNRIPIEEIKASKWYKGPIYTKEELKNKMSSIFKIRV